MKKRKELEQIVHLIYEIIKDENLPEAEQTAQEIIKSVSKLRTQLQEK